MNGFNDKALQAIWDGLGLPADIKKQEEFERLVYEWADDNERIVRCRDCKHFNYIDKVCDRFGEYPSSVGCWFAVNHNGFCAWGERREIELFAKD